MTAAAFAKPEYGAAALRKALDPARLAEAHINPSTGLATDFLNHFNEAIMILEMLPEFPECIEDLIQWQPMTYPEHFAASNLKDREIAIAAYDLAEPQARRSLDEHADMMNAILASTSEAMQRSPSAHAMGTLARDALARLKPLVAQAGAVINGAGAAAAEAETGATQAAVDALLER